jgi:putative MFS transporter
MQPADDIARRLDLLPFTPRLGSWIGRLALGGFFEIYDVALTAVMSPGLQRAGVFREGAAGLFGYPDQATFAFATLFGITIGSAFLGGVSDRFGRKPAFAGAMLGYAAATVVMSAQHTAALVCAWRFLAGIGLGVEMVTIDCYLTELVPRWLRGRAFSVAQFLQLLGVPAAHLLGYAFAERDPFGIAGWRWLAFVPAAGALAVLVLRRGLPESPRWLADHGRLDEADRTVKRLESDVVKRRSAAATEPPDFVVAPVDGSSDRLWRAPLRGRVVFLVVANTASSVAFYGFANWLPSLLHSEGVPLESIFGYTAAVGLTYPLAPLVGSLFADRIERKWQIVASAVLAAALGLALSRQNLGVVWVVLGVLLAASNQVRVTVEHIYRSEIFPTAVRARAVGAVYSVSRIGAAVSSYAVGACFAHGGATAVFALLAFALGICALATGLFGPLTGASLHQEVSI